MKRSVARKRLALFLFAFRALRKSLYKEFPRGQKREFALLVVPEMEWLIGANGDGMKKTLELLVAKPERLQPIDFYNVCYVADRHMQRVQNILRLAKQRTLPPPNSLAVSWDPEEPELELPLNRLPAKTVRNPRKKVKK